MRKKTDKTMGLTKSWWHKPHWAPEKWDMVCRGYKDVQFPKTPCKQGCMNVPLRKPSMPISSLGYCY